MDIFKHSSRIKNTETWNRGRQIVIVCPWCGVGLLYLSLSLRKFYCGILLIK